MTSVGTGYALDQLARALREPAASARVARWRAVIDGTQAGTLTIGSRTPTAAPAWVTLDVVHGGFATGAWLAGGPPQPHERALATRLGVADDDRRALNLHYLTDDGRGELRAMLRSGGYHLDAPEAGALLVVVALLDRGDAAGAIAVLDEILPFADRLRCFPIPADRAADVCRTVRLMTVRETRAQLARITPPPAVAKMREALAVWTPMTDVALALLGEIVDEEPTRPPSAPLASRADLLVAQYRAARAVFTRCQRPHRPGETLATAIALLHASTLPGSPLTPPTRHRIRALLAAHARKHGAPGSLERKTLRRTQAATMAQPTRADSATATVAQLAAWPEHGGVPSLDVAWPASGVPGFASVRRRAARCLDGTPAELVAAGVLTSGEAVAQVLPQLAAQVRAHGLPDAVLVRLGAALDAAFRRRRSLLLTGYQAQVRFDELPWVAALETLRTDDAAGRAEAWAALVAVARVTLTAFPYAAVPNPLIGELGTLAQRAGHPLPLVPELAADIFQGGFTAPFVRAAAATAARLEGTLYARYYDLPIDTVRGMAAALPVPPTKQTRGVPHPGFGALCVARAGVTGRSGVAANGCVIEQAQILTSGNVVVVAAAAGLDAADMAVLARRCVTWMLRRLRAPAVTAPRRIQLEAQRQAAIAWRQAIALISLAPPAAAAAFVEETRGVLARRPDVTAMTLVPHIDALAAAFDGTPPTRRFLGWSAAPPP